MSLFSRQPSTPTELEWELNVAKEKCAELEKQLEQAGNLDQQKNTFVATASHQLRTPLTTLRWILSAFQTDPEIQKLPNQTHLIAQAFAGVDRIIDTVNDLVNVSRIQNGQLPFSLQNMDVRKITEDIIRQNTEVATSRQLTLDLKIDSIPSTCRLDPILFKEVLENMLNNALDYSSENTTITITLEKDTHILALTLINVGIGIKPEEQSAIGQPFFRGADAILAHPDGSGLGLYLVQAITRAHSGSFEIIDIDPQHTRLTARFSLAL